MNRIARIASIFLVGAAFAGCNASASIQPTPITVYVTPAPTQVPPSAEPPAVKTHAPTPEPTIAPTDNLSLSSWIEFASYVGNDVSGFSAAFLAFDDDLQSGAQASELADATTLVAAAHVEITWLDAHPASPCYRQVWTNRYNQVVDINNSVIDYENGKVTTAIAEMKKATAETPTTTEINAAGAACMGTST
jgi:hypothetical protein